MSFPTIPNITPSISLDRGQVINLLLSSIAFEELGLAHIINAEGEKIQAALGTLPGVPISGTTVSELLSINRSVEQTLKSVIKKQMLLQFKLEDIISILPLTPFTPQTFTTPGFYKLTVPVGASGARIRAVGAAGGTLPDSPLTVVGKGASLEGDFLVTPGESLAIIVGGMGGTGFNSGGGGGGSFVWRGSSFSDLTTATLLVAAGGGGGGGLVGFEGIDEPGRDASLSPNGTPGQLAGGGTGGAGGTGGSGGAGGTGDVTAGGGGGAGVLPPPIGNGGNGANGSEPAFTGGSGGESIQAGGAGGAGGSFGGSGGFGGGGGGGAGASGGGGGFSGGGGGSTTDGRVDVGGGGGGSLSNGTNQLNTAGVGTGDGSVTITFF